MTDRFNIESMVNKGLVEVRKNVWEPRKDTSPAKSKKTHKYNAKATTMDGIRYDSKREHTFKVMLDYNKIPYNMKEEYVLQSEFVHMGEKIRAIKIIPDFTIYYHGTRIAIVDTKGVTLPDFKIKVKFLKHKLFFELNLDIPVMMPSNQEQMNKTVRELLILMKQ